MTNQTNIDKNQYVKQKIFKNLKDRNENKKFKKEEEYITNKYLINVRRKNQIYTR
jgi:hypothetical protein